MNDDLLTKLLSSDSGAAQHLLEFLHVSEVLGLAELSKSTQKAVRQLLQYDPFAAKVWPRLGIEPGYMVPEQLRHSTDHSLATEKNKWFTTMRDEVGKAFNNICAYLKQIPSSTVTGDAITLQAQLKQQLKITPGVNAKNNCRAVLRVNNQDLFAVNFLVGELASSIYEEQAKQGIDGERKDIYQLVPSRHAEMRLLMSLYLGRTLAQPQGLAIDLYCCVFCAVQFCAMGYSHLIQGWTCGQLRWYTFLPAVVYFVDKRKAIWGEQTEAFFQTLDDNQRLAFLFKLVEETRQNTVSQALRNGMSLRIEERGDNGPPTKMQKTR